MLFMSFDRTLHEKFRQARQLNIFMMMIIGISLSLRTKNHSNIFLNMLKVSTGAFLGAVLGRSPEFFSQIINIRNQEHLRIVCLILACSTLVNNSKLNCKDPLIQIKGFLILFNLIGPEILDALAVKVAENNFASSLTKYLIPKCLHERTGFFATYLTAGYTAPIRSAFLYPETISEFTPTSPKLN